MKQCPRCEGCGKIANDDEGTPWKYWLEIPLGSAAVVLAGIVRPLPCPACGGSGEEQAPGDAIGAEIEGCDAGGG